MSFLKLPVLWAVFVLFAILMLTGCGKKAKGLDTDANGYQCHQCKLKFYTDEQVWAEFCPGCKASGVPRISGYVCPKDGIITIPQLGESFQPAGTVNCAKCGTPTGALGNPRSSDFQAWGAVKKTRQEVCAAN